MLLATRRGQVRNCWRFSIRLLLGLVMVAVLAACTSQADRAAQQRQRAVQAVAVRNAAAARKLSIYRDLLQRDSAQLALPIGEEILARYAGTPAATAVAKTLSKVKARANAEVQLRSLQALWSYQSARQSGAVQYTAAIYNSTKTGLPGKIRLVLRRHAKWGQSVYLFGTAPGFRCRGLCRIRIRFDTRPWQSWAAYLPHGSEPALFIKSDQRFIRDLKKSKIIQIKAALKGQGRRVLRYQVGGFITADFPKLPHSARR